MRFVTIHHAELNRSARVPEVAVATFQALGWVTDAPNERPVDDQPDSLDSEQSAVESSTPLTDASTQGSHDIKES